MMTATTASPELSSSISDTILDTSHEYDLEDVESNHHQYHDQLPDVEEYKATIGHRGKAFRPDPIECKSVDMNSFSLTLKTSTEDTSFGSNDDHHQEELLRLTEKSTIREQMMTTQLNVWRGIAMATCAILVLLAILLPAILVPKHKHMSNRTPQVVTYLMKEGFSSAIDLQNKTSPQYLAAHWMADEDKLQLPIPDKLFGGQRTFIQRYALAVLYFATGGPNWKYQMNFLRASDVCTWYEDFTMTDATQGFLSMGVHGCVEVDGELAPYAVYLREYPCNLYFVLCV